MNIKKEFLYNDPKKIIPIQLLRTTCAVSDLLPEINLNELNSELTSDITISFPDSSSNVAILLTSDGYGSKIVDIKATAPNSDYVIFKLKNDTIYNLYIVSKNYVDGYVSSTNSVTNDPNVNKLQLGTSIQTIELTMEKSSGRNTLDGKQWYNYTDSYSGALIWTQPIGADGSTSGDSSYLIKLRDIVGDMINCFNVEGIDLSDFSLKNSIRTIAGHDNLVKYVRKLRDGQESNLNGLDSILNFLSSNQNLRMEYVQFGYEMHDIFEETLAILKYGAADVGIWSRSGIYGNYQSIFDSTPVNIDAPWFTPHDEYYNAVFDACRNLQYREEYPCIYPLSKSIFGKCIQFGVLGHLNSDGNPNWHRGAGSNHPDGDYVRRDQSTLLARDLRDILNSNNDKYRSIGLRVIEPSSDSRVLFEGDINNFASDLKSNVYSWLVNKMREIDEQIVEVGYAIFPRPIIPEDQLLTGNTAPDWWSITIPASISNIDAIADVDEYGGLPNVSAIRSWVEANYSNSTSINGNEFYSMLYSGGYLDSKPIWDNRKSELLNNNIVIIHGNFPNNLDYTYNSAGFNITYSLDMQIGIDYVDSNISKIFVIDDIPIDDTPTPTPQIERIGYPQAQEAILQNIRFIKDLINSVDENLWASFNNTNSLILSNLIGIRDDIVAKKQTGSIVNIISSKIENSQIEVVWQKLGNSDLLDLNTSIGEISNSKDIKLINLDDNFNLVGKYIIIVRPSKILVSIDGSVGDIVYTQDLIDGLSENYYYGYNAQLYDQNNNIVGSPKIVVGSVFNSSKQYLKLSPLVDRTKNYKDYKLELWSNSFIPILIEVDIVEHNATTLSYSLYGPKEFNTNTGMCTLWDYNGNVYKQLSFGRYSNNETNGNIIEYRTPLDGTGKY